MSDFIFGCVMIDPDSSKSKKVTLDLFKWCANFWRPGQQYSVNEYVRPNVATGFAYQNQTGASFTSRAREPVWSRVLGGSTTDGSGIWTTVAAGSNGLNAIASPSATSEPSGLAIDDVAMNESTQILATYTPPAGASEGQEFEAIFDFTLNGVPRRARQLVRLKKR